MEVSSTECVLAQSYEEQVLWNSDAIDRHRCGESGELQTNEAAIDPTSAQRPDPLQRHRFRAPLPLASQLHHPPWYTPDQFQPINHQRVISVLQQLTQHSHH